MAASKLRVRARAGLVTRIDLLQDGIRRMVGRKLVPHQDAANGHAWVDTGETEEIPNLVEYRYAIKDGALWAADEETARAAFGANWRANFDPSFGTAPAAPAKTSDTPAAKESV